MTRPALLAVLLLVFVTAPVHEAPESDFLIFMPAVPANHIGVYSTLAKGVGTDHSNRCHATRVGATWHYNWSGVVPQCPHVESVPMIGNELYLGCIETGDSRCQLMDSEWLLGFNEPDDAHQSNLTADEAAALWPRVERLAAGRKLVSPAVVWDLSWLARFRTTYRQLHGRDPQLDALAVHCYYNDIEACKAQVLQVVGYAVLWGIPEVWVTEWEFWGESGPKRLLEFVAWMEAHPLITRYVWYPCTCNDMTCGGPDDPARQRYLDCQLVTPDGTLTAFGLAYAWAH